LLLLEDLTPTPKPEATKDWRPAVEFNGTEGEATTRGFLPDEQPDFDKFLEEAGFDSKTIEIVGEPRTSRWQVARPFPLDPQWLTAYRFRFRRKTAPEIDLPTLYAQAKQKIKKPLLSDNKLNNNKVFVIVPADYQVGKVASGGGTPELIQRVLASYANIEAKLKKENYSRIVICDAGDIVESVSNTASMAQLQSNDLSPMQQVDLAASLMWDLIKMAHRYAPVTYASVGSNHCQWRFNGQTVGKPGLDDWGIVILQQLRRLSTEVGLDVTYLIPQPYDESLAFDVFGDGFHILAVAHGHQAKRPNNVQSWLEKQTFGQGPISSFSTFVSGHFHHLRVEELGKSHNGGSRYWIQASTSDNGSDWYRLTSGSDSSTAITCFELEQGKHFRGTVYSL
jgi:hypothetical protein